MIAVTKYVRSLYITNKSGTGGEIEDPIIAESAFGEFINGRTMRIDGDFGFTLIPYHAVDHVITSVTQEQVTIDNDCDLPCSVMPDPTLTVPQETITVEVGEEFDPMTGVSATDGNNHDITDSVTVEATEPPTEGYLMTEDSVDITNENDEPLIGE